MYNSQSEHRILFKEPIRNESKYKRMPEARETLVTIGFSFESDWLRKWREYFGPVTERSEAKPKQSQIYLRHWIKNCSWSNNILVKWNLRANALNLFETISKRLRKDERMYPLLVMLLCISVLFFIAIWLLWIAVHLWNTLLNDIIKYLMSEIWGILIDCNHFILGVFSLLIIFPRKKSKRKTDEWNFLH